MLHKAGALCEQVRVPPRGQHPADGETQDANDGIDPGFPPIPAPGNQQRQEGDDDDEKQHLDDSSRGDMRAVDCSYSTSVTVPGVALTCYASRKRQSPRTHAA